MKKIFSLFLALMATTCLWAEDFSVNGIYYNYLDGKNVEVTYRGNYADNYNNEYSGAVTIPETVTYNGTTYSVTSIGNWAFSNCSSLTSVTIGNSVTSIGEGAFWYCSSLTSVTIPNSVTSIGDRAFYGCSSLTSLTIGESVTSIGNYAFYSCSKLSSIIIPNSVTSIGSYAFRNCSSLTFVTIPNSVTSIESSAFSGCSSLPVENNLRYADTYLVEAVDKTLSTYSIKDGTKWIGNSAFSSCRSLASITIPNSVTSIGSWAFEGCSSLTSVTIPNSVTSIGSRAFYDCSSLTSVTINSNAVVNKDHPHYSNISHIFGSQVTEYIIGDAVKGIGEYAFSDSSSLTSITIPNSVTSIGNWAFFNCSSLTSVTIPNSVTSIGKYAFRNCSSLTSVAIPNSVTSIGGGAFYDCKFVKDNFINNSTLDAVANNYWGATIADIEIDGLLIKNDTVLVACRPSLTSVAIPNSVTSIGGWAFRDCSSLTSVTIGNSVTSIGYAAFLSCSSLTSVTIPNSVTSIGWSAFEGCSSLTSVTIPNSVTSIGEDTFRKCSSLTSVTIGESVTSIGNYAFEDCSSLKSIYCKALTPPDISTSSFPTDMYDNATLYVPFESIADYKADSGWGIFKDIQYIDTFYHNDICYQYIISEEILSKQLTTENDFNAFTNISVTGAQTWHYDSQYGAKMSGYIDADSRTYSNEDWLISPAMDLSQDSSATLDFVHAFGPKAFIPTTATQKEQYTCWVSNDFNGDVATATWTELPITYGTSAWSFITTTVDIPAEHLKANCHIAWKYVCKNSSATWEIKSVEVRGSYTQPAVKVIAKNDKYSNDIVIPSVVTHNYTDYDVQAIAANAFSDCASLTSATIGSNVTSIANSAFSGCTALNEITLPASITSIGENAFAGCTKLYDIYCYAMEPPTAYESSFANYNAFLHVPCDNQRVYLLDVLFGEFKYIECIGAGADTPTDGNVAVVPGYNDVTITWPTDENADTYSLVINKDNQPFCTLTFNQEGQLLNIAFAPGRDGSNRSAQYAVQTVNGYRFTVTGLTEATRYGYNITTKDAAKQTIATYSGEFTTKSNVTTDMDNIQSSTTTCQKIMRNGQLVILRDGKTYTTMGAEIQ